MYVSGGYHRLLVSLLQLVLKVYRLQNPPEDNQNCDGRSEEEEASRKASEIARTFATMSERAKSDKETDRPLISMDDVFEEMVNVAEVSRDTLEHAKNHPHM